MCPDYFWVLLLSLIDSIHVDTVHIYTVYIYIGRPDDMYIYVHTYIYIYVYVNYLYIYICSAPASGPTFYEYIWPEQHSTIQSELHPFASLWPCIYIICMYRVYVYRSRWCASPACQWSTVSLPWMVIMQAYFQLFLLALIFEMLRTILVTVAAFR